MSWKGERLPEAYPEIKYATPSNTPQSVAEKNAAAAELQAETPKPAQTAEEVFQRFREVVYID